MSQHLSPEEATRLVLSPDGPPHADVVAAVGPDVAWNASARRFERVKVSTTDLAAAGLTEPVNPKPAEPARRSRRK